MPTIIKQESNIKLLTQKFTRNSNNSVCDALIYKPINIEEIGSGELFISGEIERGADQKEPEKSAIENSRIINQIFSQIKKEYYKIPKRDPRKSFEESVKRANALFAEIVTEKKHFNIQNVNFIIAAYSNQSLYFTACGKIKILLLRGDAFWEIEKKLLIEKKIYAPRVFTNIATGRLANKDFLILATSGFSELLPSATIKTIAENNTFEKSCEYISNVLQKNEKQSPRGLIVIKVAAEENIPIIRYSYEELKNVASAHGQNRDNIIVASGSAAEKQSIDNANEHRPERFFSKRNSNIFFKQRLPGISYRAKKELFTSFNRVKYFFWKIPFLISNFAYLKNIVSEYFFNDKIRRKKIIITILLIIFLSVAIIIYFATKKSMIIIK